MTEQQTYRVWDWPVRVLHWAFVVLIGLLWWTYDQGDMDQHVFLGQLLLCLVIFRLFWGFWGSASARFSRFIYSPRVIFNYAKRQLSGKGEHYIGHNPLGGLMVPVLLLAMLGQAVLGLFSTDDIFIEGPLYSLINRDLASELTSIHRQGFYWLLGLVGLHVLAIIWHWFKGESLVPAMITGRKRFSADQQIADEARVKNPGGSIVSFYLRFLVTLCLAASPWIILNQL